MKHCPNPECSARLSSGSAAEYRSEIESCTSCQSLLIDGPAPPPNEAPPRDDNPLVTIASFTNPYQAHLARAALASHGIEAFVQHDHGQYVTMAMWVQLQVARRDCDL